MNDEQKSQEGYKTMVGFFRLFGDDIHAQILLEELFKGLINEESLFIFGQQVETGDQIIDSSPESMPDIHEVDGNFSAGSANELGSKSEPDYL